MSLKGACDGLMAISLTELSNKPDHCEWSGSDEACS